MSARPALAMLGAVAAVTLAACSPEPGDFRDDAESFIDDNDKVSGPLGVNFSDAECTEPASTGTGEVFTCLATGDDGQQWQFTARIESERNYLITAATPVGDEPAPASTIA